MSYKIILDNTNLEELNKQMKNQKNAKIQKRLIALKMKHQGLSNKNISIHLGVHQDTITDWFKIYLAKGINGLCELNLKNRRKSRLEPYIEELKKLIKDKNISTLTELQSHISSMFGIDIETSWLSRYCKKNFIALIKKQD